METISGMRRRGYTPESIRDFCERAGISKRDNVADVGLLEYCVREHLNKIALRRMVVFDPLKVVITNYAENSEVLHGENNPEQENSGTREIPFGRELYIEKEDFMENPPKKFFRLAPGREVHLVMKTHSCRVYPAGQAPEAEAGPAEGEVPGRRRFRVLAFDCGAKRNILRCLAAAGCKVTVVPATATAEEVLAHKPDGVFLANGPGDPAATGEYAVPVIRDVIDSGIPTFGIRLGHQMLGLAVGARTIKMHQGHHGANHPVKDLATGKVEITSQNHGFAVDPQSVERAGVELSHVNLNDGTCEGLRHREWPVFSVQYHPEASPGPHDANQLFRRFVDLMASKSKGG